MGVEIIVGDCRDKLREMPDESVHCCVTSPPYWGLRDYGVAGMIGLEDTFGDWLTAMVEVFGEVRRVLRKDGTLWLNVGDAYASQGGDRDYGSSDNGVGRHDNPRFRPGSGRADGVVDSRGQRNRNGIVGSHGLKPKDLLMMPARTALALQQEGWWLRSEIIWAKPNPMPESVTDRPTSAHEKLFLLTKSSRYFYDAEAVREVAAYPDGPNAPDAIKSPYWQGFTRRATISENRKDLPGPTYSRHRAAIPGGQSLTERQGRNLRNVWNIATAPFPEAHFATFPPALVEPCIKAGCLAGGTVLDPFGGSGTTGLVSDRLGRDAVLIELNPEYAEMARRRIDQDAATRGQGPDEIMRGDDMPLFAAGLPSE